MRAFAVATALLLLGAADHDTIWLKDGRKIRGLIVSETETEIEVMVVGEGSKGGIAGTATVKYRRDQVDRIERMPDEARKEMLRRAKAFKSRRKRLADGLAAIRTERVYFMGLEGLKAVGTGFEVYSTCEERFVKLVTYYLDEVVEAYKGHFDIRRETSRRVRVYLLSDAEEYTRFQMKTGGAVVKNPAYYHIERNHIVAYDMVPKEEAQRIRKKILETERQIKDLQQRIEDGEEHIEKEAKKARKEVNAEAARVRNSIIRANPPDRRERLRKLERWRKEQLGKISRWKRDAKKELEPFKKQADATIAHNREVLASNSKVVAERNRKMFELLFHEGFHAFTRNFLWPNGGTRVPRWLDEGLASYYEMSVVEGGHLIHGAPYPGHVALLRKEMDAGTDLRMESLIRTGEGFIVAHGDDSSRSSLRYALSWAIAHYMAGRVPRERVQAYVTTVLLGADPVKAFEAMMGKPLRQVQADVLHHVRTLP